MTSRIRSAEVLMARPSRNATPLGAITDDGHLRPTDHPGAAAGLGGDVDESAAAPAPAHLPVARTRDGA
ncbi:hypothetical protein [Georgenia thermotolerans]|uniref:Uncharacterized protein n=1 Tax=Georgenia thermotolerans TaxID=527326 RepID=A0A7J5UTB2_9MICO|nr:hypothetical protein [Georgenia thermotolerans]KAE8765503.1 hypothetical protein GB883_03695 [Georgenia thermotolerans]